MSLSSDEGFADAMRAATYMESSTAIVHGEVTPCTLVPRLFDGATKTAMDFAATTMHSVLGKVIDRYLSDSSYRALFEFDPRLKELILLPCNRSTIAPFARYDIFLDERTGDFVFCELNADGSSGMNEDREVARAVQSMATFERFSCNHEIEGNELFESWIDTFLEICSKTEANGKRPDIENPGLPCRNTPHVAICDYLECATTSEFEAYRDAFTKRGIACSICDVRDMRILDGRLCAPNGQAVDAVWRRCVTSDILSNWDESQAFIDSARQGLAIFVGGFAGHIVHDKQIFRVLHAPQTRAMLSSDESEFVERRVPLTTFLDDGSIDLDAVKRNREQWVIKPTDGYGADEVYLGIEKTDEQWKRLVDAYANRRAGRPFLVQRFVEPFRTSTIPMAEVARTAENREASTSPSARSYANLSGLYVYDGQFKGVFSRLGPNHIVTGLAGGLTAATFWVDCERP